MNQSPAIERFRGAREAGKVELRRRIYRVVRYIDQNAESMPSLDVLGDIACLSRFHLIRAYHKHVGETPGQTALRLRLSRARARLGDGFSVFEVARAAGYGSPQAFSVAFQNTYGEYPSWVKRRSILPGIPPHIEWLQARMGVGVSAIRESRPLSQVWNEAMARFTTHAPDISARDALLILHDLKEGGEAQECDHDDLEPPRSDDPVLRMEAVIPVTGATPPRGFDKIRIPGGPHLVIREIGQWSAAKKDLARVVDGLLPRGKFVLGDGPVLWRPLRDPGVTPPSERVRDFYFPLRQIH